MIGAQCLIIWQNSLNDEKWYYGIVENKRIDTIGVTLPLGYPRYNWIEEQTLFLILCLGNVRRKVYSKRILSLLGFVPKKEEKIETNNSEDAP